MEGYVKLIETVTTFLAAVLTLSYEFYRYKAGIQISSRRSHLRARLCGPAHHFQKLTMLREGATAAWNDRMFSPLGCLSCWLWNCIP